MRIDINLLPEKPKKNYLLVVLFGLSYGALMVLLIFGIVYYQSLQREYVQVENRIETTQQLQNISSEQQSARPQYPKLSEYIYSIEETTVSSIGILDELVSQLPRRASFVNYEYNENGAVNISVSFNQQREVSSFLHHLINMEIVNDAMVHSIDRENNDGDVNYIASFSLNIDLNLVKEMEQEQLAFWKGENNG